LVLLWACALTLSACGGGNDARDPALVHAEALEGSGESDDPLVGGALLLGAAPPGSTELLNNGSFNAPSGASTGWAQRSNRTRFGTYGEVIGAVPAGDPAATTPSVARLCGYPYLSASGSDTTGQNCFDWASQELLPVPAGTGSLTVKASILARFSCTGAFNYGQVFLRPLDGGPTLPKLSIKISTDSVRLGELGTWQPVVATLSDAAVIGAMVGKRYEIRLMGNTSTNCRDPNMSQTYVLVTSLSVSAEP